MFGRTPDKTDLNEHTSMLRENLEGAFELAREHLQSAQKRQKKYYDARGTGKGFSVGDRVWLLNLATKKGESRKLQSPWLGPFVVLAKLSAVNYRIIPEEGLGRKQVVHFNRLKHCNVPKAQGPKTKEQVQNEELADSEEDEYVPDEIDLMYSAGIPVFQYEEPDQDGQDPPVREEQIQPERQRRVVRLPAWLEDFEVNLE